MDQKGLKAELLEYVLKYGKDVTSKRDAVWSGGIAKRMSFGFTQGQGKHSQTSMALVCGSKAIKLPFMRVRHLEKMSDDLKLAVGNILTVMSNSIIDGFDNEPRQQIFGKQLAEAFGPECQSKVEFVELFVESKSMLLRHCDTQNGVVEGYDSLSSYSYIQQREKDEFRVNIICAGRSWCDIVQSKVENSGIDWDQWQLLPHHDVPSKGVKFI